MPDVSEACLWQKAVFWPATGKNRQGQETFTLATRTEVNCHWVQSDVVKINQDGTQISYPCKVQVDTEIPEGSIIRLGAESGLPTPLDNLLRVVGYEETPDIKGANPARSVTLEKYSGTLKTT